MRRTKNGTRKDESSKGMANTKNGQRSTSIPQICQLLPTVHKELQPVYNTTHTANAKRPGVQIGV